MFSPRVVSFLLLVVYGLPTIVGDAWHAAAHCSGGSCTGSSAIADPPASNFVSASPVCGAAHCCLGSEQERGQQASEAVTRWGGVLVSGDVASHPSDCAVCAFYSAAQVSCWSPWTLPGSQVLTDGVSGSLFLLSRPASATWIRGPPPTNSFSLLLRAI